MILHNILFFDMHRDSGIHEVRRRIAQQSVSRQDPSKFEARTSVDHQSKESEEYGETRCVEFEETRSGNIDFRIQGLPHSIVQKQDDIRRVTVKNLKHTQIANR